jgi:hypothetical protein
MKIWNAMGYRTGHTVPFATRIIRNILAYAMTTACLAVKALAAALLHVSIDYHNPKALPLRQNRWELLGQQVLLELRMR